MYAGLLLLLAGAFAPKRFWGRQEWLSLAAISIGAGLSLFDIIGGSFWAGVSRLIAIAFLGVVAIAYGVGAMQGAMNSYKARTIA